MGFLERLTGRFSRKYPQYQFFFSFDGDCLVLRLYHREFRWPLSDFRSEDQVAQQIEADLYYSGFRPKWDTEVRPGFVIPSEFDPRDFFLLIGKNGKVEICPVEYLVSRGELAQLSSHPSVDLRQILDRTSPVVDQGSTFLCVAHALASIASYFVYTQRGLIVQFSPEFIYHHRIHRGQEGMSLKEGLSLLVKRGALPVSDWRGPEEIPYEKASPYRARAYARLGGVDSFRYALSFVGPVVANVPIKKDRPSDLRFWVGRQVEMGHAVVFAGYNSQGFYLRNSWGPQWGDRGYTLLPFHEAQEVVTEAWALLYTPLSLNEQV